MSRNLQPFLENDLVIIRPLHNSDFKELYDIACDPSIWEQHQNKDRFTIENFTTFFNDGLASNGAVVIIDKNTNAIMGSSRFKIIEPEKVIEIGWSFLGRKFWGGSYNRAFKTLLVNYALQDFSYVIFYVHPKNYRSQKAMEKLGATRMSDLEKSWVLEEKVGITYAINSPLKD